jgi:hypothetical protein
MSKRLALAASMTAVLFSASIAGAQAPQASGAGRQATADARSAKPEARKTWVVPKTPWGHPDLQGEWTSDSARGIPRERPEQFAARAELTDQELAEREARDAQTIKNAVAATGVQTGGRDGFWRGSQTFRQTSLIVEPADGRMPPLTPEAQARATPRDRGSFGNGPFDSPESFTLYDRCITRGIVGGVLPVPYGNGNRILQTPDAVVLTYEMIHDTRVIQLDGRAHIGPRIRQYLGDSRGHWEGNTLVVETTNFTDKTGLGGNGNGLPHSEAMRMVERFTRTASDVMQYSIRIDDPKTFTRPWTLSLPLVSPPGFQTLPYECHEGNGAIKYILAAERAEDKAIADDLKKGIVRPRKDPQNVINRAPEE